MTLAAGIASKTSTTSLAAWLEATRSRTAGGMAHSLSSDSSTDSAPSEPRVDEDVSNFAPAFPLCPRGESIMEPPCFSFTDSAFVGSGNVPDGDVVVAKDTTMSGTEPSAFGRMLHDDYTSLPINEVEMMAWDSAVPEDVGPTLNTSAWDLADIGSSDGLSGSTRRSASFLAAMTVRPPQKSFVFINPCLD